jgi:hypothetical protein
MGSDFIADLQPASEDEEVDDSKYNQSGTAQASVMAIAAQAFFFTKAILEFVGK